jgi:Holliday junction resolvase RusA-like endonuclease
MTGFTVELLPPPSANNAFVNGRKGRFKSKPYKVWCAYACAAIKGRVPGKDRVGGKFYVAINLPAKMRGDIDNRVKGILDALVASTRVDDDKHMDELHVCRRAEQDFAVVIVRPAVADVARAA